MNNKVEEAALNTDPELLQLLMGSKELKDHFFTQVDKIYIFDTVKFQRFITHTAFLDNSYTRFKNKIGLFDHSENTSMLNTKQVVLNFPFKDCILKGGQTKADQKRAEVFYNESLMPLEIDRLLEPKAFENIKYYDKNGEHSPEKISPRDNLVLKGNNLLSLHSLTKVYRGQVKLIYIDPPYNTGNDSFNYNDNFSRSTWLTFMKNRLEVAWDLLHKNGAFFIQVDDGEYAYLKVLCDELFGEDHFREAIVLKSSTESGVNAINVKRGERLFKVKEYILFYSKSATFRFRPFYRKSPFNKNYKYEVICKGAGYQLTDLSRKFQADYEHLNLSKTDKKLLSDRKFEQYALSHPDNIYSLEKNIKKAGVKFKAFAKANKHKGTVEEYSNSKGEQKLIYNGGVLVPLKERLVREGDKNYFGVLASDLWTDIGTTPSSEGGISFKNGKKPEKLLKRLIEMTTQPGDLVLDYHLGSGTTAAVAHKMNRHYIGLEQLDYGENDSTARLKKVIKGEQSGISKTVNWKGGGSFVYAELAENNLETARKIEHAQTAEALATIYHQLKDSAFVDYTIDFESFDLNFEHFKQMPLAEQKKVLFSILDKNHLYINLSDLRDADFGFSEKTIALNRSFYS